MLPVNIKINNHVVARPPRHPLIGHQMLLHGTKSTHPEIGEVGNLTVTVGVLAADTATPRPGVVHDPGLIHPGLSLCSSSISSL